MRVSLCFITILLCSLPIFSMAQAKKTGIVKGKVVNKGTLSAFNDVKVSIPALNAFTATDGDGNFVLSEVPYGTQMLVFSGLNAHTDTETITVDQDVVIMKDVQLDQNEKASSPDNMQIPTIAVEENNNSSSSDDGLSGQNASGMVVAGRDPFVNTAAFVFGFYRFQARGYRRNPQEVQVNGIPMNDLETGNASWGQFGGLNDVFRGRNVTYGINHSDFTFGGINGASYIEATAADQRKENRISYTIANRNYRNRLMFTKSSGLMKNGWAYSVSFSKRWAKEGYVPGTFYDGYSYYGGVTKVLGKGRLNFTTFGAPTIRGKASAALQEVYDLAGTNYYNRNWGYQNGKKRNFAVQNTYQPMSILNYEYQTDKTRWNTAASYQFGKDRSSSWAYYNAYNPVGDYYKNLPSYYENLIFPDLQSANAVREAIINNPNLLQFDWDNKYQNNYTNIETIRDANGIAGNTVTGRRSLYAISERVSDLKKFVFNTNFEHAANEHMNVYGGITYLSQQTEMYNQMADLLGGDFFLNNNQFATQKYISSPSYTQNDLNKPNAIIKVGDKWGSDYAIHFNNASAWGQTVINYKKFDVFAAATVTNTSFYREGFFKNGLFPNNSFGKSEVTNFLTYGVKGGATLKIDSRNALFVNATYATNAPNAEDTYISPEKRDNTVVNPGAQITKSVDAGYRLRSSRINARIAGYATDMENVTDIKRFFNDDPDFQNFVNYVMKNMNTRSLGTEIAIEVKATTNLNITGVAAVGQSFYNNRPDIYVYNDNDTALTATPTKSYIKNYYLAAGPQSAYTLGFNYKPGRSINIYLNFNYFDRNYVDINPNRRTPEAGDLATAGTPTWQQTYDQEKLPSVFTTDIRASKVIKLYKIANKLNTKIGSGSSLFITAGISNLFNNRNIINSGFEQLRFDFTYNNPSKFPNRYIYGPGINFFVNVSLNF